MAELKQAAQDAEDPVPHQHLLNHDQRSRESLQPGWFINQTQNDVPKAAPTLPPDGASQHHSHSWSPKGMDQPWLQHPATGKVLRSNEIGQDNKLTITGSASVRP